jgi:hypothetical protein
MGVTGGVETGQEVDGTSMVLACGGVLPTHPKPANGETWLID